MSPRPASQFPTESWLMRSEIEALSILGGSVRLLGGSTMQRGGRHLSEKRLVRDGEAPEMPEAVSCRGLGHCRLGRGALPQRPPRQMHSA